MQGKLSTLFKASHNNLVLEITNDDVKYNQQLYNKLQTLSTIILQCPCCNTKCKIPNPFLGLSFEQILDYNTRNQIICDTDNVFVPMYRIHKEDGSIMVESKDKINEFIIENINTKQQCKIIPEQVFNPPQYSQHIYIFKVDDINDAILCGKTKCTFSSKILDIIDMLDEG